MEKSIIFTFCVVLMFCGHSFGTDESKIREIELSLFKNMMHPFMVKNCSECHGENAIYPQGPKHGHSNPDLAFDVFRGKIEDINNISGSKFWRVGSNQHYCNEFSFNCDKADDIVNELQSRLTQYGQDVGKKIGEAELAELNQGSIIDGSMDVFDLEIPVNMENSDESVFLLAKLVRIENSDYVMLESLSFKARPGIYAIKDITIFVDGQKLLKQTGFERTDRSILIPGVTDLDENYYIRLIDPYQPIFKLTTGQAIEIRAKSLRKLETFESILCDQDKNLEVFKKFVQIVDEGINLTNFWREDISFQPISSLDKHDCYLFESELNLEFPRRSVIYRHPLTEGASKEQFAQEVLNWIDRFYKP